jgi:hypothetical protein
MHVRARYCISQYATSAEFVTLGGKAYLCACVSKVLLRTYLRSEPEKKELGRPNETASVEHGGISNTSLLKWCQLMVFVFTGRKRCYHSYR